MTTGERWTVYPLLLLAIGLAMRGQLVPPEAAGAGATVSAETVVCRELAILGESDTIIVHAGRVKGGGGGRIEIRDARGIDAVAIGTGADARTGVVEFFDDEANLLDTLGPRGAGLDPSPSEPGPAGVGAD